MLEMVPVSARWGVPRELGVVAAFRRKIGRLEGLPQVLGATDIVMSPSDADAERIQTVVGWGHRPTIRKARAYAERHGLPFVRLEDGFLRSVRPNGDDRPLSLILDDRGIYYDAGSESLLESWLNASESDDPLADPSLLERAGRLVEFIVRERLSKYNNSLVSLPSWIEAESRELVVVVDQTRGDQSIARGLAGEATFEAMLEAALDEHPQALVLVKTHPDVRFRGKRGHFSPRSLARHRGRSRIRVVTEPLNPVALLQRVAHAYVCTSQVGFEALLCGTQVTCFGAGFYSGWGLTEDRAVVERRRRKRTVTELAAAALLLYPRYIHPVERTVCEPEVVLEHLALQRTRFVENRGATYCFGFTPWKRGFVRDYLATPGGAVHFCRDAQHARRLGIGPGDRMVAWGSQRDPGLIELAGAHGSSIVTMEDGFLRSVGLGSDFTMPASLVLDGTGIYYDPTRPSDLEQLLQTADFSAAELQRAAALRERIVSEGLTKYSLGDRAALSVSRAHGRRVVLVPGQVEDDASIQLGASATCRTNASLLAAARELDPEAYLVYKPHPEVLSGNRKSAPVPESAYDQLVVDAPLAACLGHADAVHTMTSLVGFEALLRGIAVVTHGRPFYAGWGLTSDQSSCPRRTRKRTLDELVAGALLRYPRYYSYSAGAFVSAEDAVSELLAQRAGAAPLPSRASRLERQKNKLQNLLRDVVHAF
jgi:capsular polysaccharide export protein